MTVTAYVTRDIGRTFGVTHGPITRSDPIRSDPALLQLHRWSPSHHGVQKVDARDSATVVAPSPVTTPDAMMSLTAIAHLDFEPERECEHPQHPLGEMGHSGPAWALVEVIHLCASPSRTLVWVCRGGWDEAGARGTHCQQCGENLTRDQSWRIVQVLR
jgi:hypothetical protein